MIIHYVYDGTFEGFLTSIHEAYYRREDPEDIIRYEEVENNFLIDYVYIKTDEDKFKKVYKAIDEKISSQSLRRVFYCYLSELPRSGKEALDYIGLGFKIGPRMDENLANDTVRNIDNIYKKVSFERHRMLGLIRFKELEKGLLYAKIEPDHNIVALIAPHFARRMRLENWLIHDVKRKIGVVYSAGQWTIRDINIGDSPMIREDEEEYQSLWKTYFSAISIEGKTNPKLQRSHMPKRYWKHLVEKE